MSVDPDDEHKDGRDGNDDGADKDGSFASEDY